MKLKGQLQLIPTDICITNIQDKIRYSRNHIYEIEGYPPVAPFPNNLYWCQVSPDQQLYRIYFRGEWTVANSTELEAITFFIEDHNRKLKGQEQISCFSNFELSDLAPFFCRYCKQSHVGQFLYKVADDTWIYHCKKTQWDYQVKRDSNYHLTFERVFYFGYGPSWEKDYQTVIGFDDFFPEVVKSHEYWFGTSFNQPSRYMSLEDQHVPIIGVRFDKGFITLDGKMIGPSRIAWGQHKYFMYLMDLRPNVRSPLSAWIYPINQVYHPTKFIVDD